MRCQLIDTLFKNLFLWLEIFWLSNCASVPGLIMERARVISHMAVTKKVFCWVLLMLVYLVFVPQCWHIRNESGNIGSVSVWVDLISPLLPNCGLTCISHTHTHTHVPCVISILLKYILDTNVIACHKISFTILFFLTKYNPIFLNELNLSCCCIRMRETLFNY